MKWTLYEIATERIIGRGNGAAAPTPGEGQAVLENVYADPRTHRVVAGVAVPKAGPTLSELKDDAFAEIARRRWEFEVGGVTVSGAVVATDDRSKVLLAAAANKARADSGYTTRWKTGSGWVLLDAAALLAIESAVFAHVQAAFDWERVTNEAIAAAATAEDVTAILEAELSP